MQSDTQCRALPVLSQELKQVIGHNEKHRDLHGGTEVGDNSGGRGEAEA